MLPQSASEAGLHARAGVVVKTSGKASSKVRTIVFIVRAPTANALSHHDIDHKQIATRNIIAPVAKRSPRSVRNLPIYNFHILCSASTVTAMTDIESHSLILTDLRAVSAADV